MTALRGMREDARRGRDADALLPCKARYLEHAVCLAASIVLTLSQPAHLSYRAVPCLYVCVLAICVEEVAVIPAARRWKRGLSRQAAGSVYRHASNPGLVLGSCVVPWVCLVLDAGWMLACSVLSSTVLLLWTAISGDKGTGQAQAKVASNAESLRVVCICLWVLGWCVWQLYPDLHGTSIVLSLCCVLSTVAVFFSLGRIVPGTCTMGESIAVSAASMGVSGEMVTRLFMGMELDVIGSIVSAGLLAFLAALIPVMARRRTSFRKRMSCIDLAVSIVSAVGSAALAAPLSSRVPLLLWSHLHDRGSVQLLVYWTVCMTLSLPCMMFLKQIGVRNIILRKGFHALALLLFVPPLASSVDGHGGLDWSINDGHDHGHRNAMLPLALAIAFVGFLILEITRLGEIPLPLGMETHIHTFMASFVDSRDTQGELYATHITLLLGLAVPMWLGSGITAFAGMVATGVGDAVASIVGSLCGRRPIAEDTNKTVEGALACLGSMLLSWWMIATWCEVQLDGVQWARVIASTGVSSALESVTDSWDNVFVSLTYFCLLTALLG